MQHDAFAGRYGYGYGDAGSVRQGLDCGRRARSAPHAERGGKTFYFCSDSCRQKNILKFVYEPITARAARHALVGRVRLPSSPERGRFTGDDVTHQLDAAWKRYDGAVRTLPLQPTRGSTF